MAGAIKGIAGGWGAVCWQAFLWGPPSRQAQSVPQVAVGGRLWVSPWKPPVPLGRTLLQPACRSGPSPLLACKRAGGLFGGRCRGSQPGVQTSSERNDPDSCALATPVQSCHQGSNNALSKKYKLSSHPPACPPAGSVRALAVHPGRPLIASVGLDRFLRVHDTRTRQPVCKVYLKSQLTGALPGLSRAGQGRCWAECAHAHMSAHCQGEGWNAGGAGRGRVSCVVWMHCIALCEGLCRVGTAPTPACCSAHAGVQFCPVSADMLPQQQQQAAGEAGEGQQGQGAEGERRRKKEKRQKEGGSSKSEKVKRGRKERVAGA